MTLQKVVIKYAVKSWR